MGLRLLGVKLFSVETGTTYGDYNEPAQIYFAVSVMGIEARLGINVWPSYSARSTFRDWWKCDQCGKRFGKHDESVAHVPF